MNKKNTLSEFDIVADSVSANHKNNIMTGTVTKFNTVLFALAIGGTLMLSSCADEKSCTDTDITSYADGNGSTAYDTGTYQDPTDFGGDTDTTRSGDLSGSGDICRDSD